MRTNFRRSVGPGLGPNFCKSQQQTTESPVKQQIYVYITAKTDLHSMGGSWGGTRVRTSLKNHKNKGFLSNTGPDPLKNHKATKPAFNVVPSSARQRIAILMAFRWRINEGPLIVVSTYKEKTSKLDPLWQNSVQQSLYILFSNYWQLRVR